MLDLVTVLSAIGLAWVVWAVLNADDGPTSHPPAEPDQVEAPRDLILITVAMKPVRAPPSTRPSRPVPATPAIPTSEPNRCTASKRSANGRTHERKMLAIASNPPPYR